MQEVKLCEIKEREVFMLKRIDFKTASYSSNEK